MLLIVVLYMLFAISFTIAKIALAYASPLLLIGIRMMLAGTVLLGWHVARYGSSALKNTRKDQVWLLSQLVIVHIFAPYVLEFWGLQYLTSAKTALIYSLSPFITALFAWYLVGEKITMRKLLGLLIGFGGMLILLMGGTACEQASGHIGIFSWAELAVVMSVICSVYGWIVMKKLTHNYTYPIVCANGIAMLFGGILSFIMSCVVDGWPIITGPADKSPCLVWGAGTAIGYNTAMFFGWVLLLILVANIICYNLYGTLLKAYSATLLSFFGFLCPLFSAFFGWMFLGEAIGLIYIISFACVVVGLYIFYQDELLQRIT